MADKTFTVSGTFKEKNEQKKFTKEMHAVNENFAREKVFSQIGSKHGIARNGIKIISVAEKKE